MFKVVIFVFGLLTGILVFFIGPDQAGHTNDEAVRILVTVFSVLSGFLIASITITGNPGSLRIGSWRIASSDRRQSEGMLALYTVLFYVYLVIILTALLIATVRFRIPYTLYEWLRHGNLSLGVAAIVWSFGLPISLAHQQMRQLDRKVEDQYRTRERRNPEPPN